jgi:hypothetical protein
MRDQWRDMAGRRTYLTGGIGAHHQDEAFGDPYELPPDRSYAETCAAIGSIAWNWRMLLATGEARHADLLERTLLNGFLAGLALDGSGYSYVNPLHVRDDHVDPIDRGARRRPWYECACCPPNAMRLLASLQHHLATADAGGLQVHQYTPGELRTDRPGAGPVAVRVGTAYPWDGAIEVEVVETGEEAWTLSLRVPAWCTDARLVVASVQQPPPGPGYVRITRPWRPGDRVELVLAMPPRLTAPHPRIDAVRGCLAIERGPLVLCVESADAPAGVRVDDLRLDPAGPLREVRRPDLLGGIVAVEAAGRHVPAPAPDWPYAAAGAGGRDGEAGAPVRLLAVPYALWGNRGDGAMRVWIPRAA